jgi:hypothetical protein
VTKTGSCRGTTLSFAATNGTKLSTGFWVDDVSVLA